MERHRRQVPLIGEAGQARLAAGRVLVVGVGGLGCSAAEALARMGVGTLTVMDGDRVEVSNLHRQCLYTGAEVGLPKAMAAEARLRHVAPACRTTGVQAWLADALDLVAAHDVVVDGTDDPAARLLLDATCRAAGVPWVHAALWGHEAQVTVFTPEGPCYRCLHQGVQAPACDEHGVLGALPAMVGAMQAVEAVKLLTGQGRGLAGRLLLLDTATMATEEVALRHRDGCDCRHSA